MGYTRRQRLYRGGDGGGKESYTHQPDASDQGSTNGQGHGAAGSALHGALKAIKGGGRRARTYRFRGGRRVRSRRIRGGRKTRTRRGGRRRRRRGGSMGSALLPFGIIGAQQYYAKSLKRRRR